MGEGLGNQPVEDRDVLVHGVLLLPRRRLHLVEAGADDHLHVLAAEAARGAAAVHCGVAAAQHDHATPDALHMAERDAGEPVDADVDMGGRLGAARDVEVATARRAAAHEDRVIVLGEQRLEAVDPLAEAHDGAEACNVAHLLVDDAFGQAEARDLAADHAARLGVGVIDDHLIAHGREVARHGERGRAGADAGDPPAVALLRRRRQAIADVVLVVGRHALQAADGHRLFFHAHAPAGRLARPVARPPEDAREDVGLPVDHIGVRVSPLGDQPDVFRHRRVGRAGPLAVDNLMKIFRGLDIRRLQSHEPSLSLPLRQAPSRRGQDPRGTCRRPFLGT